MITTTLDQNPRWLSWNAEERPAMVGLRKQYTGIVTQALGRMLARIQRMQPDVARDLVNQWESIDENAADRIIVAPAMCYHSIFLESDLDTCVAFFRRSVAAERWRATRDYVNNGTEFWSASGDLVVRGQVPSRHVSTEETRPIYECRMLRGSIPVDFRSPEATGISLDADHPQIPLNTLQRLLAEGRIALYSTDLEEQLYERLERVMEAIGSASRHVAWVIEAFTLTLVVRHNPHYPERFTSGSTGQFVGRTCLVNPTAIGVDDAVLADALVHEAIHSVLYMQERGRPWVHDRNVYYGHGFGVKSPWTGNFLTPRQFMQACFVWFGLYRFWSLSGTKRVFGMERASAMAEYARKGFYSVRLVNLTQPWESYTDPLLLQTIQAMQEAVLRSDFPELESQA